MDAAPELVRRCHTRWRELNPDFEFVTLSQSNLHEYIDLSELPIEALKATSEQAFSDAVRLTLLRHLGGVWVDATTWPRRPLNEWNISEEFFAFAAGGNNGRPLSNWFLYSHKGNHSISVWQERYINIFRTYGPLKLMPKQLMRDLWKFLGDFSVFLEDGWLRQTRTYPYYLCHNVFSHMLKTDEQVRREWRRTLQNPVSLSVVRCGRATVWAAPTPGQYRRALSHFNPPIIKLDWRVPLDEMPRGSLMLDILSGGLD